MTLTKQNEYDIIYLACRKKLAMKRGYTFMKKRLSKKKLKKAVLCSLLIFVLVICLKKYEEAVIYDKLHVNLTQKVFEYGNNVQLNSFVEDDNKETKYSIVKDLDTSHVGTQKVEVKVEYKGISKVVPIKLSVVDTTAPSLEIKEEVITIEEGDEISLMDNIGSVTDNDTPLEYQEIGNVTEGQTNYYTVDFNGFNVNIPGEYVIYVTAVDQAGNKTQKEFKIVVKEAVRVVQVPVYRNDVTSNASINASGNDIVSIAYSFLGHPYVYGGNSPETGFDCSGFVQYVYSRVGKSVSRSSYTQAYDGVGVSYSDAQPGDILSWGHGGQVTHSAIYIGNGQMIHAMNSNTGVVLSNVDGWTNADVLMAVRRVA